MRSPLTIARETPMILYEAGAVDAGWPVSVEVDVGVEVAVEERNSEEDMLMDCRERDSGGRSYYDYLAQS
jgi:hypothetical protein